MITLNNSNIDFGFEDESLGSKYSISLSRDTSNLIFKTDGVERMIIMKNGKVDIGYDLDVNGSINAGSYLINDKNISTITSDTSNYIGITSNILVGRINDTSNYVKDTSNILIGCINNTSNYVKDTCNILIGGINNTSNYAGTTSNILIVRINNTSNYVKDTCNILIDGINNTSNYVGTTSNILIVRINNTSNYVRITSNILIGRINDTSNYVKNTCNILIGSINDISNILIYTSNILVYRINDTSNYIGITSNIFVGRINNTSNYVKDTSNILIGCINNTSNYVKDTCNILIGGVNNTCNYIGITSNIFIGRINNTSNYVISISDILVGRFNYISNYIGTTSNILIDCINNTSNYVTYTSNILIVRFNDTSNYVTYTSNILIGRFNYTSNYAMNTSNILVSRINNTSNYVNDTSNILIGCFNYTSNYAMNTSNILVSRINNTSNYVSTTSNILVGLIKSNISTLSSSTLWTTTNNNISYNTSYVGIGTNNPISKLHLYDEVSKTTKLTIQNNKTTTTGFSSPITFPTGVTSNVLQETSESVITFPYKIGSYTFTTNVVIICDILLVGGGGGGRYFNTTNNNGNIIGGGGGGGGGGYVYLTKIILPIGVYTVFVGAGDDGITNSPSQSSISGPINYIAYNGGIGGSDGSLSAYNGIQGGSGGGAGINPNKNYTDYIGGLSTQYEFYGYGNGGNGNNSYNNNGLWVAGGGGGAGGFITNYNYNNSNNTIFTGNGVNGLSNNITGVYVTYAGGGGGGASSNIISNNGGSGGGGKGGYISNDGTVVRPIDGSDGLGGGGGGNVSIIGTSQRGGKGGNGIVIIRYKKYETKLSSVKLVSDSGTNGIIDYKIGNYDGDFKIISSHLGTTTDRLVIKDGNVGIGTTTPKYMLDVAKNSSLSNTFTTTCFYFSFSSTRTVTSSYTLTNICAKFTGSIWITGNCYGTCDARIKEDIQDINDDFALQMILAIEPKTYKYIDKIENGDKKVYGFIAQQVQKVIPEAVSLENAYIPNIMILADYNNNIIMLPHKPAKVIIKIKDKIKCYDSNNNLIEVEVSEIINNISFKIKDLDKKYTNNKIFVYGTFVNDFYTLSKEHIYTLNVGATQELYKQIKEHNDIIKSNKRINTLQKQNKNLNENYEMLLKEITLIKQKINSKYLPII